MAGARPPLPGESSTVAELVLLSDCGMLPALFGPRVKDLIARLQRSRRNPYSSENTLVFVDEAGAVMGALVGSRTDAARGSELATAALLLRFYGPAVLGRLPRLARAGRTLQDLAPDDFYLSHIAVLPRGRGHGFGGALLRQGEAHARGLGCARVVLDVEEGNAGARAFYDHEGYRPLSNVTINLGAHGAFRFLRLAKGLEDPPGTPARG